MNSSRNLKLIIAYDGTRFAGWQRQKNAPTIQGLLEEAVHTMTGESITLHGAGRTDAGVHALGMTANFTTAANIPCTGFLKGLNSILPVDIRILEATEVAGDFHARRNATAKTYFYCICNAPLQMPTDRLYSSHVPGRLAIDAFKACLEYVRGAHDFSSFEASGSRDPSYQKGRGAVRRIFEAEIDCTNKPDTLRITLTGDGFLRHMVRNIVGTLVEVGRDRISVSGFKEILAARDRSCAGPTAPPHGLFLKEVHYHPVSAENDQIRGLQ